MAVQQQKGNQKDTTSTTSSTASASRSGSFDKGPEESTKTSGTMSASSPSSTGSQRSASSPSSYSTGSSVTAGSAGMRSRQHPSEGIIGQVKSTANDALGTVKTRASEKIEEQKHTLAGGLTSVADNIRRLGSQVATEPQTSESIAKYAGQYSETAAAKLEQAATYFDENDLNAIYHDVENAARNNAAIFIGGAFALGFLAARFLKSSRTGTSSLSGRSLTGGNGESREFSQTDAQSLGH